MGVFYFYRKSFIFLYFYHKNYIILIYDHKFVNVKKV